MAKIVLGVTASTAAYKAACFKDALIREGHDLKIVMTDSANKFVPVAALESDVPAAYHVVDFIKTLTKVRYELDVSLSRIVTKFITPLTIQTACKNDVKTHSSTTEVVIKFKGSKPEKEIALISRFCEVEHVLEDGFNRVNINFLTRPEVVRKVYINPFEDDIPVAKYLEIANWADLFLIAPLSVNTLADLAMGRADNIVSMVYLAARRKPTVICPVMDIEMWEHMAVQNNLKTVLGHGNVNYIEPREFLLVNGGTGDAPKTKDIVDFVNKILIQSS